jgi:hypothetical protein
MTLEEIITALRARATQTVPFTGMALGDLKRGASYAAAQDGTLGVETFWVGGKLRTASIDILRRLGVEDEPAPAKINQPAETTPPVAPVIPLAAPQSATAKTRRPPARKAMSAARKAPARKAAAPAEPRRQARSPEVVG